jgi:hypothetical protein
MEISSVDKARGGAAGMSREIKVSQSAAKCRTCGGGAGSEGDDQVISRLWIS